MRRKMISFAALSKYECIWLQEEQIGNTKLLQSNRGCLPVVQIITKNNDPASKLTRNSISHCGKTCSDSCPGLVVDRRS